MTTWQRCGEVHWRRSGQRCIVRSPLNGEVVVLEGGGSVAWEVLAEPCEEQELFATISGLFEVEAEQVGVELTPFLEELSRLGVLVRV